MEEEFELDSEYGDQSTDSNYLEPPFDAFFCPLTKQIMKDPVTIETGQTFEREAIVKWFRECKDHGRRPTCPLTQKELHSTEIVPSQPLKKVIEEWRERNEDKKLERARASLETNSENEILRSLAFVVEFCRRGEGNKSKVRRQDMIPKIAALLKNSRRRIRLKALEALSYLAKDNDDNKEAIGSGDTMRTIIKFLSNDHIDQTRERELAISLLCELSSLRSLCQVIGGTYGAILILVGMASSKSENILAVEKAEQTLKNMEEYEINIKQMAESGRLQPLLTKLVEGSPEEQVMMAEYLGELVLPNDVKVIVAEQVGAFLVTILKTGSLQVREATLKALREISSNEASAKILLNAGILPPLIEGLFTVSITNFPMRLKEVSASILANLVASDGNFKSIVLDDRQQTLLSENVIHSLLHLISNTGPAIESKLLQVLVGLTGSPATVNAIVAGIKSSGAVISLIQFIEAGHREIRVAALKLLENISPYMLEELADALGGNSGHIGSLVRVISESNGLTEEETSAVCLLADLPEEDLNITRQLFEQGAFRTLTFKLMEIRRGTIRHTRYITPFMEGAAGVLCRITFALRERSYIAFAVDCDLALLFADLLQMNGLDKVQLASAVALRNLSEQSAALTGIPVTPPAKCKWFKKPKPIAGLCRIHSGFCSLKNSFCLVEGGVVEKLIACLDHRNVKVVEAALGALCTILRDGVDIMQGVFVLFDAEGYRPIIDILQSNRSRELQRLSVWAVERILRIEDVARDVAGDQSTAAALVEAYKNGEDRTRQTAERALKHLERLPKFSSQFTGMGQFAPQR